MACYKIYENETKTVAFINKNCSIVFIFCVFFLWGGLVSLLPDIWTSFSVWELMTTVYLYYPFLGIVLLFSLYLAYCLNKFLLNIRTKWLVNKGYIFLKEVNMKNIKQVADLLFSSYRFERESMGCVGVVGSAFILLLLASTISICLYTSLNQLIFPSYAIPAKVSHVEYSPSNNRREFPYYKVDIVYTQNNHEIHSRIRSLFEYEQGDNVTLRHFKENRNSFWAILNEPWLPYSNFYSTFVTLLFYLLTLVVLIMMVHHRKVYATSDKNSKIA